MQKIYLHEWCLVCLLCHATFDAFILLLLRAIRQSSRGSNVEGIALDPVDCQRASHRSGAKSGVKSCCKRGSWEGSSKCML
jgi:hypothetical protein